MRFIPKGSAGSRSFGYMLPCCILTPTVIGSLSAMSSQNGWVQSIGTSASISAVLTALIMTLVAFLSAATLTRSEQRLQATVANLDRANLALSHEMHERRKLEELARHQATHDPLTGIANRALFADRLQDSLQRAQKQNTSVALFYMDVDSFKPVNDQYGHAYGDDLLIQIARRIANTLRQVDTAARLGGDEFAAIMEGPSHADDALQLAKRLCLVVAEPYELQLPASDRVVGVKIGISIGIAVFPTHSTHIDELVILADRAMYRAKAEGKNRCLLAA